MQIVWAQSQPILDLWLLEALHVPVHGYGRVGLGGLCVFCS